MKNSECIETYRVTNLKNGNLTRINNKIYKRTTKSDSTNLVIYYKGLWPMWQLIDKNISYIDPKFLENALFKINFQVSKILNRIILNPNTETINVWKFLKYLYDNKGVFYDFGEPWYFSNKIYPIGSPENKTLENKYWKELKYPSKEEREKLLLIFLEDCKKIIKNVIKKIYVKEVI